MENEFNRREFERKQALAREACSEGEKPGRCTHERLTLRGEDYACDGCGHWFPFDEVAPPSPAPSLTTVADLRGSPEVEIVGLVVQDGDKTRVVEPGAPSDEAARRHSGDVVEREQGGDGSGRKGPHWHGLMDLFDAALEEAREEGADGWRGDRGSVTFAHALVEVRRHIATQDSEIARLREQVRGLEGAADAIGGAIYQMNFRRDPISPGEALACAHALLGIRVPPDEPGSEEA